jgi:hypothetical protein
VAGADPSERAVLARGGAHADTGLGCSAPSQGSTYPNCSAPRTSGHGLSVKPTNKD